MTGKRPFWQTATDRLLDDLRKAVNDALDRTFGPVPPQEQTRPVVEDPDPARTPPGAGPLPDGAIPAGALDTGTAFFSRISGLSSSGFAPRAPFVPGFIRAYEVANELAHTLQPKHGIALGRSRGGLHLQECFADCFSILALARHGADFDSLDQLVASRDAKILTGNLTDWTGPAARAALKSARALHDKGELAGQTTDQMLTLAAQLARTHALPESGLRTVIDRRRRVLEAYGITTFGDDGILAQDGKISDPTGGVETVELLSIALRAPDKPLKATALLFVQALDGLPKIAYMPRELRQPTPRREALEAYRQDIERCLADAVNSPGLPDAIWTRERQRVIEQGRRHEQWSPAERDGPVQSTTLTLQRLKVIDSITPPSPPQTNPPANPPAETRRKGMTP